MAKHSLRTEEEKVAGRRKGERCNRLLVACLREATRWLDGDCLDGDIMWGHRDFQNILKVLPVSLRVCMGCHRTKWFLISILFSFNGTKENRRWKEAVSSRLHRNHQTSNTGTAKCDSIGIVSASLVFCKGSTTELRTHCNTPQHQDKQTKESTTKLKAKEEGEGI